MLKTLILTRYDVDKVLTMKDALKLVEKAFLAKALGKVQMPPKQYLSYSRYAGDLRVMPAYLEDGEMTGVKIVNSHPHNPEKFGLPSVMAVFILINPENGFPVSIMDATDITAFRTGAAGGVAAKYLAKDDPETFGFVGAGRQAKTQLLALNEIYGIKELKVYDPDKNSLLSFERFATKLKIKTDIVTKIESAVKGMDVLTTTTPVSIPVIKSDWVSQGTHINAIGADAPGKQELDALLLKRARIFVDDMEQAYHGGEVNVPLSQGIIRKKDISGELGEVIAGSKPGRKNNKEITIFDSTGLALQDVPCAHFVYNQAGKKSIGRKINLIDF